ncbi:MAG: HepT-like ribonuclease domain-containing protein [Deltaproteobacteria bacterium]|nr:HepT-like ribonuclease domain-containing protein [Deltaproteobacteria bacterium]
MNPGRALLAEKAAIIERHLARVASKLPPDPNELSPQSDASDAIILHLWQAVQLVIDLAVSTCVREGLGTPVNYGDAFKKLAGTGILPSDLAERLSRAAGFRNVVAHAYDTIDMRRVHQAAASGPADLRAFLAALAAR